MRIISAEIPSNELPLKVSSNVFVDIPGLKFELPPNDGQNQNALLTLNVPTPFAEGHDFPGATFAITVDDVVVASGGFTYESKTPASFARVPFTLVKKIQLKNGHHAHVKAQWTSVRNSAMHIDSFASLSAVVA